VFALKKGMFRNNVSIGPEKGHSRNRSAATLPLVRPPCSTCVAAMEIAGPT
jgi:hypothetical protein